MPIENNYEIFDPLCEVDYKKFEPISRERFEWENTAVLGDWMPFVVLPKQTVTKHLIFQTRWDEPVIQDNVYFELEMYTNVAKKWQKVAKWKLGLPSIVWSELAEVGTSFMCKEIGLESIDCDEPVNPSDLHKYTGTKSQIPKGGFQAKPSYLDYPDSKTKRRKKA